MAAIRDSSVAGAFALIFWCGFYAAGIVGMMALYGILQERIMTKPYGGVMFRYSIFLVLCNRVAAVVFSAFMLWLSGEPVRPQAPIWKYTIISASNVYASSCQYEALKHVTFVVLMLGKSFKMMPVMLWGMALGKRYSLRDWSVAVMVTIGVAEFLLTGPTVSPSQTSNSLIGYLLLLAFLALDGATSTFEEKLFSENRTSKYNQMLYVNGLSSVVSFFTLAVINELVPAFGFWVSHPHFMVDTVLLSIAFVGGQFFIVSQVKEFGALVFAATMTVRQLVSIIISYVHFHHSTTAPQILGLLAVFLALFYKSFKGLTETRAIDKETQPLVLNKTQSPKDLEATDANEPPEGK